MRAYGFAFKRMVKHISFVLLLLLCAGAVLAAALQGDRIALPKAGLCDLDGSPETRRMAAYLEENGFVPVADEDTLYALVQQGQLDCGFVLPQGFSQMLQNGDLEGAVRYLYAPTSYSPELFRSHMAAAIYREHVPYITAEAFTDTDVSTHEVLTAYNDMMDGGYVFSFEAQTLAGGHAPEDVRGQSLILGAGAILLFLTLIGGCSDCIGEQLGDKITRLGLNGTLRLVVLPNVIVRMLTAMAVMAITLALAAYFGGGSFCRELILPVVIYCLLISALGLVFSAILPAPAHIHVVLPVLLMASLALCPIFADLAIFSPAVRAIRYLLPPYWLWLVMEKPLIWLAVGLAAFPAGCGMLCLRYRFLGHYCIK